MFAFLYEEISFPFFRMQMSAFLLRFKANYPPKMSVQPVCTWRLKHAMTFATQKKAPSIISINFYDFIYPCQKESKKGSINESCLRSVHTRELAPETRSRVSTPTSTHEGHDEGAE